MKIKRLNARGFSHDLLLVAFVVIFAISGVAYLVASRADSCDGSASGVSAVSEPGSGPASGCSITSATCTVTGVPANPAYGQTITPQAYIINTGNTAFVPTYTSKLRIYAANGSVKEIPPTMTPSANNFLVAGHGLSRTLSEYFYKVDYSTSSQVKGVYTVESTSPVYSCKAEFTLPPSPAALYCGKPLADMNSDKNIDATDVGLYTKLCGKSPALPNIVFEAENLGATASGANASDPAASNKQYRAMYRPGISSGVTKSLGSLSAVTVKARAKTCNGSPQMVVVVDNKSVLNTAVGSTDWADYTAQLPAGLAPGNHTVAVAFTNDYSNATCDRELHIDSLTFAQKL